MGYALCQFLGDKRVKKKLGLLVAPALMLGVSMNAFADFALTPYIGADAQLRYLDFKRGFGDNLFKHNSPQGNAYVGLKFNQFVGIEMGYQATKKQRKSLYLTAGQVNLGTVVPQSMILKNGLSSQISPISYTTQEKTQGFHMNIVGFYPIFPEYGLELFGSVGITQLKTNFSRQTLSVGGVPPLNSSILKFKKRKNIFRANIGLQQMITDCIGFRGTVGWENTAKFNKITPHVVTPNLTEVRLKNSIIYSLGLFRRF